MESFHELLQVNIDDNETRNRKRKNRTYEHLVPEFMKMVTKKVLLTESSILKKYCIYLSFDQNTAQKITDLRVVMSHEVDGVKSPLGKMMPHITVGIIKTANTDKLFDNFNRFSECVKQFDITLEKINSFDRRNNRVIYVEPILNDDLKETFHFLMKNFEREEIGSEFRIEQWKPHCTLAKRLSKEAFEAARQLAINCWLPVVATISTVGLVDVMEPLKILKSKSFANNTENGE